MSTFLIVEDDALHRNFLREVIALSDLECTELIEADDGEEAIRLFHLHDPKGVIMDLQMPKKSGVQAAKAIWAENPKMPIVFWSNYADEAYVRGITKIVPASATYGYLLKTNPRNVCAARSNAYFWKARTSLIARSAAFSNEATVVLRDFLKPNMKFCSTLQLGLRTKP